MPPRSKSVALSLCHGPYLPGDIVFTGSKADSFDDMYFIVCFSHMVSTAVLHRKEPSVLGFRFDRFGFGITTVLSFSQSARQLKGGQQPQLVGLPKSACVRVLQLPGDDRARVRLLGEDCITMLGSALLKEPLLQPHIDAGLVEGAEPRNTLEAVRQAALLRVLPQPQQIVVARLTVWRRVA